MGTQGRLKVAPSLVIANGQQNSNALPAPCLEDFVGTLVYGPAALDGGLTYVFQVNPDPRATTNSNGWVGLCDASGAAIGPPGASKAQFYSELPHAGALRIRASGNVGAERVWHLTGIETV